MYKQAAAKSAGSALWDAVKGITGAAKLGYEGLEKLSWYMVPTVAVLGTLGAIRALKPEAVSENADKLLLQETLLSSLAKSKRKYDQAVKNKQAADLYNTERRHDRFI